MGSPEVDRHGENYDPSRIFYRKVGGVEFRISGVGWQEDNYGIAAFEPLRNFFEEQIPSSKGVVMEFPPAKSEYTTGLELMKIDGSVYDWGVNQGLRELCKKYNKRVFVVDPICNLLWGIQGMMFFGSAFVPAGLVLDPLFTKLDEKKLSRRHFMELVAISIFIARFNKIFGGTTGISSAVGQTENKKDLFLRKGVYGPDDFRNIRIAQGLPIVSSMVTQEEGTHALVIGGWTHSRAIDYYLKNEGVLKSKAEFYGYGLWRWFGGSVREYACEGGEWKKVNERPFA